MPNVAVLFSTKSCRLLFERKQTSLWKIIFHSSLMQILNILKC